MMLIACTNNDLVKNDSFAVRLNDSVGATRAPRYVQQGSSTGSGAPATTGTLVNPTNAIGSITPNAGVNEVTHFITITGTEFEPNPIVLIGSTPVVGAVSVSDTVITGTVPTGIAPGVYDVTVQNVGMAPVVMPAAFTVYAPATVTVISPPNGVLNLPINVTISGTNFRSGAVVRINGTAITVGTVGGTSISATVPANTFTAGVYNVTVQNPGELVKTLSSAYTVENPPVITAISPSSSYNYNTTPVTVTGNYFKPGILTARIGAFTLTGISYVSPTTFTATLAANNAPGSYTVSVQNAAQGLETSGSTLFTLNAMTATVSSVTPSSSFNYNTTAVTINGANFVGTPTALFNPTVMIGGWTLTGVTVVNPTTITGTLAANLTPGTYNVTVQNYAATAGTLTNGFTINSQVATVSSITPTSGLNSGSTAVTITGTNFVGTPTAVSNPAVAINGWALTGIAVVNSTTITGTLSGGRPPGGPYSVSVTNYGATGGALAGAFTVTAPPVVTVTNVAASSGTPGTVVTIAGTNFLSGAVVRFGGTNASTTFVSSTTLQATVPALTAGSYSVSVVNPFQAAVTWGGSFTVL